MNKLLIGGLLAALFLTNSNAGIYCKYLNSCSEACYYLNQGYYRLDRDRDGIPCENLCHRPCGSSKSKKSSHLKRKSSHNYIKSTKKYKSNPQPHNEKYYQKAFCKKILGIMEYRLSDGTRVDCYTSTYSFEVDFAKKAYQAVGQALHYADIANNKPGIALIVRKKSDIKYVNKIKHTAKKYKIKIFTIDKNLKIRAIK